MQPQENYTFKCDLCYSIVINVVLAVSKLIVKSITEMPSIALSGSFRTICKKESERRCT